MNLEQHVRFWRDGSVDDMDAAEALLEKRKYRHALFFTHLALEKLLKAHVTRTTNDVPPRIHNLIRLAESAGVVLSPERTDFLNTFDLHQIEGRYPDQRGAPVSGEEAAALMEQAREMAAWLMKQF